MVNTIREYCGTLPETHQRIRAQQWLLRVFQTIFPIGLLCTGKAENDHEAQQMVYPLLKEMEELFETEVALNARIARSLETRFPPSAHGHFGRWSRPVLVLSRSVTFSKLKMRKDVYKDTRIKI
jgi:hypothetical protein